MGIFAAGQVVLLRYPFSDLSGSKFRPGVILAQTGREDWIICQITSNPSSDKQALPVRNSDFTSGGLAHTSYVRPGKIFTAHESLISKPLGDLKAESFALIRDAVIRVLRSG